MFGSSIIEVAIGLVFVYLLMSLICSAVNEIIESLLKNRATDLERGIRELFNQSGGGGLAADFYKHPLINGLFRGQYRRDDSRRVGLLDYLRPTNLPSYIPARNFAYAVLDIALHPPATPDVGRDDPGTRPPRYGGAAAVDAAPLPVSMDAIRQTLRRGLGDTQAGRALRTLAEQSGDDLNAMRANVEAWFDGSMDRVSGTYKRRTQWIIFVLGFVLTILLNVNTIEVARSLSADATLRNLVVARAEAFASQPNATTPNLNRDREELKGLGLPLGWPAGIEFYPFKKSGRESNLWDHVLMPLLGWLLTAGAISLGAPFWFDLLNKFMVVRSTVKPHEKSPEEGSEDRQNREAMIAFGAGWPATGGAAFAPAVLPPAGVPGVGTPITPEPSFDAAPDAEDNESHVDGCDVVPEPDELTPDEDLPPSEGGVA